MSLNADAVSTGQSQQAVGDWLVSAGVRDGSVRLVPAVGTSDFSPQYVGNDAAYPVIVVDATMPADIASASTVVAELHMADEAPVIREFSASGIDSDHTLYAFPVDATNLPSGQYDYDVTFSATITSGGSSRSVSASFAGPSTSSTVRRRVARTTSATAGGSRALTK